MIHQSLSPDGVRAQISSSLRLLVICLVRPACSSYITICLFKKKKLISFIYSLDKCHTSVYMFLKENFNEGMSFPELLMRSIHAE